MGKLTFRGGIHPYEGKELSKDHPIEKYLPKGDLVYPLSQHIGAPSVPCVKKGDTVLAGQKIADAGGFVSVPLHASVSGTVKGIEKHLNATGSMVDCIVIENDQQYQEVEYQEARLEDLTKEEILNRIKEGGVVGMGGAGFPTHVKLAPKDPSRIEYILVNGAECEPYITSDYRRMIEEPEKAQNIRFINKKYYDLNKGVNPDTLSEEEKEARNGNGGLNVESKWYHDPEYQAVIEAAFGKTQGTDYEFTKEDIDKIKAYVDANGIGTTRSDAALDNFYSQFVAPAKVN